MVGVVICLFVCFSSYTPRSPPKASVSPCVLVCAVSGVSVMKGQEEVHIRAPMVISNAGIFNTYQKLLPKELQAMPGKKREPRIQF